MDNKDPDNSPETRGKTEEWVSLVTLVPKPEVPGLLERAGSGIASLAKNAANKMKDIDSDTLANLAVGAVIYLAATAVGSFGFHMLNVDGSIKPMLKRNTEAFNSVASIQHLNDNARANGRWILRQEDITYGIRSGDHGWNWTVISSSHGGDDLIQTADSANIALIPHEKQGLPPSLTVDSHHGCLQVNFAKTDAEIKDQARALLRAFRENTNYDVYGVYSLGADNTVAYKAFGPGENADQACPAPMPPVVTTPEASPAAPTGQQETPVKTPEASPAPAAEPQKAPAAPIPAASPS